jgi:hypothetical protein
MPITEDSSRRVIDGEGAQRGLVLIRRRARSERAASRVESLRAGTTRLWSPVLEAVIYC